ncbi:MBL fold metallo-hydrolase [Elstera sp.]|jgi:glyoxylase-like metal-dependent hydrolase (beta-lactamase superfamily II)|uniref:MBL fold metallo-hydrolase n=1 Tax=Elstera sp. TaxID=1916664 RepID=UPI0037BEA81A
MTNSLVTAAALSLGLVAGAAQAGQLHVFKSDANGFDTKTFWYDDGREVTVIDTQFTPGLAEAFVADIRKQTTSPIRRVIVTHPNPDKFNGLSVFHKLGAVSIASAATAQALPGVDTYKRYFWVEIAKAFTAETYPALAPIQQTFSGSTVIKLASGETLTLTELKHSGVSSTQTVVKIDATGDLLVGDLVHHGAHAWLEGGIVNGKPKPDLAAWRAALAELPALGGKIIHGGRGASAPVAEAVAAQTDYLTGIEKLTRAYVTGLGAKANELAAPATAAPHYAALEKQAAAAYPNRDLSYLVGYGIYGLVDAIR